MKKCVTFFFILCASSYSALAQTPPPNEIIVCPHCPIQTIHQAIKEASPGAIIRVQGGTYAEGNILIDKPITLKGEGNPILDGQNKDEVLTFKNTSNISISGFHIQNCGFSYTEELAGLKIENVSECSIDHNTFTGNSFSIYLADSKHCHLSDNHITGVVRGEANTGNGIHLWKGKENLIENNTISNHRDGIYMEFVTNSRILNNDVHNNSRYGLHFMSSHENTYEQNTFHENGAGVAVMYSRKVSMKHNRFLKNNGPSAFGLLLKEIHDSVIDENIFAENNVGVYMEGTNRSHFESNLFYSNGWGLKFMADCEENDFRHNDFKQNTIDASSNGSQNYGNTFNENYWNNYDGYDLNNDGWGDRPFRLVSLSSVILETTDSSFPLLKSFLFSLLDQIERALPELTPARLKDDRPAITPISRVIYP